MTAPLVIAVLHPGQMGVTLAQTLAAGGHEVCWVSAERSAATAARATAAALIDLSSLGAACERADVVLSICPPDAAFAQAVSVAAAGFAGWYLDANAIAPQTALRIAALYGERYVDGAVIGPPARSPGSTRLYLSGAGAQVAARWFEAGPLSALSISELPGTAASPAQSIAAASTLKMAYAAYTKGLSALLLNVCALARAGSVEDALAYEWSLSQPALAERAARTAAGTGPKAWRFVGEMQEIARTFEDFGLPDDFHRGAAAVYQRMASLRGSAAGELDLNRVVTRLLAQD